MSTNSVIHFQENGETIASVYQHWDGYLSGVGADLADFLDGIKIVNGISCDDSDVDKANGMGCLAAQFVAQFKEGAGGLYLTVEEDEQQYTYYVNYDSYETGEITITVDDFSGSIEEFKKLTDSE